jgi:hypothetical protein
MMKVETAVAERVRGKINMLLEDSDGPINKKSQQFKLFSMYT